MIQDTLQPLGFSAFFQNQQDRYDTPEHIARVGRVDRGKYTLIRSLFEHDAEHSLTATARSSLLQDPDTAPGVGDWVVFSRQADGLCVIEDVFERHTALTRASAGTTRGAQLVAANIDTVFITTSMNQEFNSSRLERYLVAVWNAGANPVVLLNKSDLTDDKESFIEKASDAAMGVPIIAVSAATGEGLDDLFAQVQTGHTYAFIGSSGVGKSTLHNVLVGYEKEKTGGIREDDDEGRHTTTHRALTVLPQGGILIDTPGMREFGLWYEDDSEGFHNVFGEIEALAVQCRFRNCTHTNEPGCAILEAIEEGELEPRRFANYQKLLRELDYQQRRQEKSQVRAAARKRGKYIKSVQKQTRHLKQR